MTKLIKLATHIESKSSFDDIVLPTEQKQVLKDIFLQMHHRKPSNESRGLTDKGHRGLGISALFVGESGTGKTMAAEVLVHELYLDLYRIDLKQVVSKYIGETEKNAKIGSWEFGIETIFPDILILRMEYRPAGGMS